MLTLQLTPFPALTTERLILRQLTNQDAPALLAQRSDATIMQYIARPLLQSLDDALILIQSINEGIRENLSITWGLTHTGSTELIGTVGFVRISRENHRAEVGYLLHPDHRGAGLVHEALMEVIRYGFTVLQLHSIEAVIQPRNMASARVLERAGFVREAAFKQNLFHNGQFLDSAVYSLLTPLAATTEGAEDGPRSR